MEFDNKFWNRIRHLIKLYHLNFLFDTIGKDFLSEDEIDFLEKNLGKTKLDVKRTPILDKIFAFGQIVEKIGHENANKITLKDLEDYLKGNVLYIKDKLNKIKAQAYLDVLSKQFQIEKDLRQQILNESNNPNFFISNIYKFIKEKFEDWSFLGNSISYVSETALNQGKASEIKLKSNDEDPLVYKVPVGDEKTCSNCKRAYLNSNGSPKIFRLSELEGNGTNIGLKPAEWKPTLGGIHNHCRCLLQYLEQIDNTTLDDYYFDEGKSRYILKDKTEEQKEAQRKVQRRSKVKIQIGDKNFEV